MSEALPELLTKDVGAVFPPLRSLAIVGSHPDTRENAPFDDPNFEIWLYNEAPMKPEVYGRWDACVQIHLPEVYSATHNWVNADYWEWLQKDHGPDKRIFMHDVDPRVPNSVKYPLDEVLAMHPRKYLRSSPAMALAGAIQMGYKHIALYGNELSSNTEYHYQAPNYTYWIGFADGRPDITLDVECWQIEFDQPIYGFEGELQIPQEHFAGIATGYEKALAKKSKHRDKITDQLADAMMDHKYERVGEKMLSLETVNTNMGEIEGALQEARQYAEKVDPISRQEFERRSAQAQLDGEESQMDMHMAGGEVRYVWNVWKDTGRYEALAQLREFLKKRNDFAFEMGKHLGIFRENLEYQKEYDQRVQAAGGLRAAVVEGRQTVIAQPMGENRG
jgi:hypothetical protein